MITNVQWSTYNEAAGGWQKSADLKGRVLWIQPDMDRSRWYWTVVWAASKDSWDAKKNVLIPGIPSVTAWGISPNREMARADALARAQRRRPTMKREHQSQEVLLHDEA